MSYVSLLKDNTTQREMFKYRITTILIAYLFVLELQAHLVRSMYICENIWDGT